MTTLLIATTNAGKLREIRFLLDELHFRWLTLQDFPAIPEPDETGDTFAANGLLKARYYAAACGLPTVAEDSGLVIDALGGRPGVLSARYPGATYPDKFRNLYQELAPHSRPWTARFVCSLAFVGGADGDGPKAQKEHPWSNPSASNDGVTATSAFGLWPSAFTALFTTEATVEGEIAESPKGTFGFGYDPIFFYPPYGCTLGEVDGEQKLAVAHRGKAFRAFREWLTQD